MTRPAVVADPDGYRVEELGTFPRGCPVTGETAQPVASASSTNASTETAT